MKPKKDSGPKEVGYFEASVMMNDFIDHEMRRLKPAEIKLALVIFRKTIGWRKRSEQIGRKEFCIRAKLDPDTVKDTILPLCKKLGILVQQTRDFGGLDRRRYTWPINERVAGIIAKGHKGWEVGGKLPPTPGGQITPEGEGEIDPESGGQNPPTQYIPNQSVPLTTVQRIAAARERLKASREAKGK